MTNPNEVTFVVTLRIDEKWASTQTAEELVDYLSARFNSSLGFRGAVKKLKFEDDGWKQP